VRRKIQRYELTETFAPDHVYATIRAAVEAYQAQTGAEWTAGPSPNRLP
jgi:hypothetical protein